MPKIPLEEIEIWKGPLSTEYRFVAPDFDDGHLFAEVTDTGVIANMTLQLELHAKHCELVHREECPCSAKKITKTDERSMLVVYRK